jgi:hypothetical protein
LAAFVDGLASLLSGSNRSGAAFVIDYGGTSRHILDPRATNRHMRIYGPDGGAAHTNAVYADPGQYDITWDVDFTELAHLASRAGLAVELFAHQSALEAPPIDLWSGDAQDWLVAGRAREGISNMFEAMKTAHALVTQFRASDGFRLMILADPGRFGFERLGQGDPWGDAGLVSIAAGTSHQAIVEALVAGGLDPELASGLKPGGEIVADLRGEPNYALRHRVLEALEQASLLRDPGQIDRRSVAGGVDSADSPLQDR